MKKLIIIFLIFLYFHSISFVNAQNTTQNAEITKIENNLYGFDYSNDALNKRLERLEISIYGKIKSGDMTKRISKLSSDIYSEQFGKEIRPSEDTFREAEEVAEANVNYPIVDEVEQKLFNKTYKSTDFHTRIVKIERKLFGKIYDVEDYSSRMERIKNEVFKDKIAQTKDTNSYGMREYDIVTPNQNVWQSNTNEFSHHYGQNNYTRPYVNYGDNYEQSTAEDELARLEQEKFGTEFSNETVKQRLKRLKSAEKAKKASSRYDSAKFQQRMSTAMEIGAMILMILAMVL